MFDHSVAHVLVVTKRSVAKGESVGRALDAACLRHAAGDPEFLGRLENAAMGYLLTAQSHLAAEGEPRPGALQLVRTALGLVNARLP